MEDPEHRQTWRERLAHAFAARGRTYRAQPLLWKLAAPAVFVLAGALFITSGVSAGGTDLRAGRYDDLGDVAEAEADKLEELRARQADLAAQVDRLTAALGDTDVGSVQAAADALKGPAGLAPVSGPGLTVTLSDAPEAVQDTADTDINNLVVHQQDIQAVVNALWAAGAEAMTIQGQRVVSTTGVRCVGNTVVLHDVPYAPPYVISAIGPPDVLLDGLTASPYIGFYLEAVASYQLGWDVDVEADIDMPAYVGSTELSHARPAGELGFLSGDGT